VATLARSLQRHGFSAGALHGDMDQKSRMETLDQFKHNKLTLLIASDVAARGLDIPAVSHVFNFDVPTHAEDYVHRIGRTGRAGRLGTAITLVSPADQKYIDSVSKLIQRDIPWIDAKRAPATEEREAPPARKRGRRDEDRPTPKSESVAEAERPARKSKQPRPDRDTGIDVHSPFGSDGPVPAFLLRSTGR
jgi:superfamily II DNA/RNA helicase